MSKQTLKFSDIVVNKKNFYASKQAIPLDSVNTNNIMRKTLNILLAIHMMMI